MFKQGDKVVMVSMPNDPNPIPSGTGGVVENANPVDFGGGDKFVQYDVKWDNGRTLSAVVPPDVLRYA